MQIATRWLGTLFCCESTFNIDILRRKTKTLFRRTRQGNIFGMGCDQNSRYYSYKSAMGSLERGTAKTEKNCWCNGDGRKSVEEFSKFSTKLVSTLNGALIVFLGICLNDQLTEKIIGLV